jgi:thiamine biosynthesis lipoprotein
VFPAPPSRVSGKGAGGDEDNSNSTASLWPHITLDPDGRRIRLPRGARLDLGGIAKGWAADIALERLCHDCEHALINVGGDLRLRGGPQPGQAWTTGVFDPRAEASGASSRYAAVVTMSRGGLATSGSVRRWWLRDGVRRHHLLDPWTGEPARVWIDERDDADAGRLIATATALAPTAARAEVAAKVALLRGYPDALRMVEANWARHGALGPAGDADAGVALLLVLGDGQVILSQNFEDYLASWGTAGAALPLRTPLPGAREGGV